MTEARGYKEHRRKASHLGPRREVKRGRKPEISNTYAFFSKSMHKN
jgi:hypothetical protein